MPGPNYFDGGAHLTRGHASDGGPTLAELLGNLPRVRFADPSTSVPLAHQDGSFGAPFGTFQAAIDDVEQNLAPAALDPALVMLMPGVYQESPVIRRPGVYVNGFGPRDAQAIVPPSGPALTLTNATLESLAAYRVSADYADLVNQGDAGPQDFSISRVFFNGNVELLGVAGDVDATHTEFCGGSLLYAGVLDAVYIYGGLYARNTSGLYLDSVVQSGGFNVEIVNGYYNQIYQLDCYRLILGYDSTDPLGVGGSGAQYGSVLRNLRCGYITLNDEAKVPDGHGKVQMVENDVTINGTAELHLAGTVIGRHLAGVAGGATFTFDGVHVMGNMTLANAAPNTACAMNGGRRMGSLTDGGGRLTHTQGNIGT